MKRTIKTLSGLVALLGGLMQTSGVSASPILLHTGDNHVLNFDASALLPYARVQFVFGYQDVDGLPDQGRLGFREGLNFAIGSGTGLQCITDPILQPALADCVPIVETSRSTPGFTDGDFSFRIQSTGGTFSVDPYAKIFPTVDAIDFIRLDFVGAQVPEPSPVVLIAAGLFGVSAARRRKI